MYQSTDEDTTGLKDRERQRSNVANNRQNLRAVGRVASRVRKSGMLTKANSLLQRQKEDEGAAVNQSPWGVGVSVLGKEEEKVTLEPRQSYENENPKISPRARRRSDVVELSSPLSAGQHSSPRLSEIQKREQNSLKEDGSPRMDRTSDRIGSARRTEKKTERVSVALGATGAARGLVKSVSRFGFRSNDRKVNAQSPQNNLAKSRSTMTINDSKETKPPKKEIGKGTSEAAEEVGRRRTSIKDYDSSATPPEREGMPDTRIRGLHLPVLGRSRTKQDDLAAKTKVREKLRVERPRAKTTGPIRSISQIAIRSPRVAPSGAESPSNDSDSAKGDDGKRMKNRKSFKDNSDQKLRKGRASWFTFSSDSGDSQTRGTAQNRSRSKTRRLQSIGEHDLESELGSRMSAKASKDLAEMQDFAVDEYFDSEEDDMESESAPPSIAEDDFISYQTGKGKKGQGNRSRIRMKSQT